MHKFLIDMLVCPACQGELSWELFESDQDRIQEAEAACASCSALYQVQEGIGVFLTPDLPRNDMWETLGRELTSYLRQRPDLYRQLMDPDPTALSPADRLIRSYVLESEGRPLASRQLEQDANQDLYSADYLSCWDGQMDHLVGQLAGTAGPVIDLASGRCYLVEKMIQELDCPLVATDLSPRLMRQNQAYFQQSGCIDRVSMLVVDARRMPFRESSVDELTTNLGLSNITHPELVLPELRRVVSGRVQAVAHFYPEDDSRNAGAIQGAGLSWILYRQQALQQFESAGWEIELQNSCRGGADPTPAGEIFPNVTIDTIPVEKTCLEWCVLAGR